MSVPDDPNLRLRPSLLSSRTYLPWMLRAYLRFVMSSFVALAAPAQEELEVHITMVGGAVFVNASVNNAPPMPFILDTGATETVLTPAAAEKAGIRLMVTARQPIRKGTLRSIRVGKVEVKNLTVLIFDPPRLSPCAWTRA